MAIITTPVGDSEVDDLNKRRQDAEALIDPPTANTPGADLVSGPPIAPSAADPAAPAAPAAPADPAQPDPNAQPPGPPANESLLPAQFAELQRREGQLTRKEVDLRLREEKVAGQESSLTDLMALARTDKLAAIQKLGFNFEDLTKDIISRPDGGPDESHAALARELKAVTDQLAEIKNTQTNAATQADRSSTMATFDRILDNDPKYELAKMYGQEAKNLALAVQEAHQKETGASLSHEEALGQVEDYYMGRHSDAAKLTKVQSALNPSAPQPTPAAPGAAAPAVQTDPTGQPAPPAAPTTQEPSSQDGQPAAPAAPAAPASPPTLSNAHSANAAPAQPNEGVLTDADYRQRAEDQLTTAYAEEGKT